MIVVRTDEEIQELFNKSNVKTNSPTNVKFYARGIKQTLRWLEGKRDKPPIV